MRTLACLIARVAGSTLPTFTTNFGVARSTMAEVFATILDCADEALLWAKQGGRKYDAEHHGAEHVDAQLAGGAPAPHGAHTA